MQDSRPRGRPEAAMQMRAMQMRTASRADDEEEELVPWRDVSAMLQACEMALRAKNRAVEVCAPFVRGCRAVLRGRPVAFETRARRRRRRSPHHTKPTAVSLRRCSWSRPRRMSWPAAPG